MNMIELLKMSERKLNGFQCKKDFEEVGAKTKNLGTWKKWKTLKGGHDRITVSVTVIEVHLCFNGFCAKYDNVFYLLIDSLDKIMTKGYPKDFLDVEQWLREKGYKTEHDFYTQDYGMSEDDWIEWNR